jgi:hypothetical protein
VFPQNITLWAELSRLRRVWHAPPAKRTRLGLGSGPARTPPKCPPSGTEPPPQVMRLSRPCSHGPGPALPALLPHAQYATTHSAHTAGRASAVGGHAYRAIRVRPAESGHPSRVIRVGPAESGHPSQAIRVGPGTGHPSRASRVGPSESGHPSRAIRVGSSESGHPSRVIRVGPSESGHPSRAIRVGPSESGHPSRAIRVGPSESGSDRPASHPPLPLTRDCSAGAGRALPSGSRHMPHSWAPDK